MFPGTKLCSSMECRSQVAREGPRRFHGRVFLGPLPKRGCKGPCPLPGDWGCPPNNFCFNCLFRRRRNRQLKQDRGCVLQKSLHLKEVPRSSLLYLFRQSRAKIQKRNRILLNATSMPVRRVDRKLPFKVQTVVIQAEGNDDSQSSSERPCYVLPSRQNRHPLSLVDCGIVDGCRCNCFAICSTGQPGAAIGRLCQSRR